LVRQETRIHRVGDDDAFHCGIRTGDEFEVAKRLLVATGLGRSGVSGRRGPPQAAKNTDAAASEPVTPTERVDIRIPRRRS
jgi:hypothetical protein